MLLTLKILAGWILACLLIVTFACANRKRPTNNPYSNERTQR